jgi:hypothetical protein
MLKRRKYVTHRQGRPTARVDWVLFGFLLVFRQEWEG